MSTLSPALVHLEQRTAERTFAAVGVAQFRRMVLMSVPSEHSKRNYAQALPATDSALRAFAFSRGGRRRVELRMKVSSETT